MRGCLSRTLKSTASRTFQWAGMTSSCPTYAAIRWNMTGSLRWPLTKTSPPYLEVFFIASMSSRVDLPHPLGPIMATSCPGSKCPEQGSTMTFDSPFGKGTEKLSSLKVRLAGGSPISEGAISTFASGGSTSKSRVVGRRSWGRAGALAAMGLFSQDCGIGQDRARAIVGTGLRSGLADMAAGPVIAAEGGARPCLLARRDCSRAACAKMA
mmetsp:Transcript_84624/g.234640  ORF Transcript_84624/g.234640 Transcript_84624/m.234640 type:complete len:211 (+) Transcript_84624:1581-2213(+)